MNVSKSSAQKLLVIGGTSSLSPEIFRHASQEGFEIVATYRNSIPTTSFNEIRWLELDFSSINSVENFLGQIEEMSFTRILFFAGSASEVSESAFSVSEAEHYLKTNLILPAFLISRLVDSLEKVRPSSLLFMSSRSAKYGSFDYLYGIAKAGLQNLVLSLSRNSSPSVSIFSVVSGLIMGTRMQLNMTTEVVDSHEARAMSIGANLLKVEEAAATIWSLVQTEQSELNGETIMIGPDY